VQAEELQDRIAAFPSWNYRFEFAGGVTTTSDSGTVNRQQQRRRYFFEPLMKVLGGSLRGRRVLDLGCNSGLWSLEAIEAGADFVLGVDARQMYVEQAKLVFEAKQIDPSRFRFERCNLFDFDFRESFDVVLCLGLLERVARPVELFEVMTGVGAELIVIDTEISRARSSVFELDTFYDRDVVVDYGVVLVPSRDALIELAGEFKLETVPLAHDITDYLGMSDYRRQRRLAFICSRDMSLAALPKHRRTALPWWVNALSAGRVGSRRGG
jgi:SAM-dependent methyltransferase